MATGFNWDDAALAALIRAALEEDTGSGDATCAAIVPADAAAAARIIAKQDLVLAGLPLAERVFRTLDSALAFRPRFDEGAAVPRGAALAELEGRARAILSAERTALNFLGRLSGIATLTRRFVDAVAGTRARIRDTRKTTPLLRRLEKYAVRAGGGENHRFGLYDAMLIKENHIAIAGGVAEALRRARAFAARPAAHPAETAAGQSLRPPAPLPVQIEVRNEAEARAALAAGAEALLLDNLSPREAARLAALVRGLRADCIVELSGGVTLENVRAFAAAGPDFISIGALTHSAPAADVSLLVRTQPAG